MKTVHSDIGNFGPYVDVQVLEGSLLAGDVAPPLNVIGAYTIIESEDVVIAPAPPRIVPMAAGRRAIIALKGPDAITQIDAAIAAMQEPEKLNAYTDWNYRQTIERDSPLVQRLAASFQWPETDLDGLFAYADTQ